MTAVVTGADRGIGLAVVEGLLDRGHRVVLGPGTSTPDGARPPARTATCSCAVST